MGVANGTSREVFILGAGFSKALSQRLPTTDELGLACLRLAGIAGQAGVPTGPFSGGQFESWLSRIAEPQPYLDAARNATNQARFLMVRDAIHRKLTDATLEALNEPWRPWLPAFLRFAHHRRATVITFNYDTLIECAVASLAIFPDFYATASGVSVSSVTGDVPPPPVMPGMWLAAERSESFSLLKLHGSLNWYAVDGDNNGTSMLAGPLPGQFGRPKEPDSDYVRRYLPGRVPFVVPPAATKSIYFRNPIVRQLWGDAFEAITRADRITLVGYSLPLEDGTFAGLLSEAVAGRKGVSIEIADFRAETVVDHLRSLRLDQLITRKFDGPTSVPDLVEARIGELAYVVAEQVAADLAAGEDVDDRGGLAQFSIRDCRLIVEFDRSLMAVVREVRRDGDTIKLVASNMERRSDAFFEMAADRPRDAAVTGRQLERQLPGAQRLEIESDGVTYVVYRYAAMDVVDGGRHGPWLIFTSATTPRLGVEE